MFVETRKTVTGREYWDSKNKKVIVVPHGQKPDFEVVDNPKSMKYNEDGLNPGVAIVDETIPNLDEMDAEQLFAYAKENNIEVPGNMKKADTIRDHIKEEQANAIEG
ncbi:hypothetical protein ACQRXC_03875 [Niallia taxi]|uniref:hypothetical protein n=1 Tax=Niallia taxi TaxID=2499688 RepID=UPI003F63F744